MAEHVERPLAAVAHETAARQLFPLNMTPEEYAARHGANWGSFSFDQYRYRDPHLDAWIQRLGTIFFTPGLLQHYQELLLTPAELAAVQERMDEEF